MIQYPSGYVKFEHPDLAVEFIVPELGKGRSKPYKIKKLHVNAQGLRFLTILRDHVITVRHGGIAVNLPEPAAYVLHKLIIGRRRTKEEKAERDLSAARKIGEYLLGDRKQRKRLQEIFKGFPPKWQKKVLESAKDISQEMYDFLLSE